MQAMGGVLACLRAASLLPEPELAIIDGFHSGVVDALKGNSGSRAELLVSAGEQCVCVVAGVDVQMVGGSMCRWWVLCSSLQVLLCNPSQASLNILLGTPIVSA